MLKGIILVGGASRGTRFRPLSLSIPKPLFPVAGKPLLYHPVKALSEVKGLSEILIIGFYESSVFTEFLNRAQAEFSNITIRLALVWQSKIDLIE
jgi:mannose-1-phosphate guanylyltransferase